MTIKDLLTIQKLNLSILSITGAFVFVLGILVVWPAFSEPPEFLSEVSTATRSPTSVYMAEPDEAADRVDSSLGKDTFEVVDVGCFADGYLKVLKTASKHIRIRGRNCGGVGAIEAEKSEIINSTSGLAATIFDLGQARYSTDFVRLVDGANQVELSIESVGGSKRTARLTIERVPAL